MCTTTRHVCTQAPRTSSSSKPMAFELLACSTIQLGPRCSTRAFRRHHHCSLRTQSMLNTTSKKTQPLAHSIADISTTEASSQAGLRITVIPHLVDHVSVSLVSLEQPGEMRGCRRERRAGFGVSSAVVFPLVICRCPHPAPTGLKHNRHSPSVLVLLYGSFTTILGSSQPLKTRKMRPCKDLHLPKNH